MFIAAIPPNIPIPIIALWKERRVVSECLPRRNGAETGKRGGQYASLIELMALLSSGSRRLEGGVGPGNEDKQGRETETHLSASGLNGAGVYGE
jgi:hypothetical protein